MLVIHPTNALTVEYEPECPADAIVPDTEPGAEEWVEFNRVFRTLASFDHKKRSVACAEERKMRIISFKNISLKNPEGD